MSALQKNKSFDFLKQNAIYFVLLILLGIIIAQDPTFLNLMNFSNILTQPEILMLDEPTRGIDIGAKFEIYQLIQELAKKDKGIIMISSEMPELLGVTDRILVMSNGKLAGIVESAKTSQEEILQLAAKYL